MSKRKTPDFVLDYEKKLRRQCNKINNRIRVFGATYLYGDAKVDRVVFISRNVTTFGTSEATIITVDGHKWNAGSQIFNLKEEK